MIFLAFGKNLFSPLFAYICLLLLFSPSRFWLWVGLRYKRLLDLLCCRRGHDICPRDLMFCQYKMFEIAPYLTKVLLIVRVTARLL
jgi:hypothetical protein